MTSNGLDQTGPKARLILIQCRSSGASRSLIWNSSIVAFPMGRLERLTFSTVVESESIPVTPTARCIIGLPIRGRGRSRSMRLGGGGESMTAWHDCHGKFPYETLMLAQEIAGRRRGLSPYKCPLCRLWHVGGTRPGTKWEAKINKRTRPNRRGR